MGNSGYNMITILGHTAGGKTAFAANLAAKLGGEIISADSRQVYRGMDLGTGKDYNDYIVDGKKIPYHLIDIVEAGYEYNLFEFQKDFIAAYEKIIHDGKLPVMCGGSGLYIESVLREYKLPQVPVNPDLRSSLEGMDHEKLVELLREHGPLHNTTDISSRKRLIRAIEIAEQQAAHSTNQTKPVSVHSLVIGIRYDRNTRRQRITERLKHRLEMGMAGEVESLMKKGITAEKMHYYGLEYRIISRYLLGEFDYDTMFSKLNTAIHQFAKRQMTYFRGMERRGVNIEWIDGGIPMDEKVSIAMELFGTI